MEYYSAIKWNNTICSNMVGPRDYYTKWNKSERERQMSYNIIFMWNLKNIIQWTYLQNRNKLTDIVNKLWFPKRKGGGGIN